MNYIRLPYSKVEIKDAGFKIKNQPVEKIVDNIIFGKAFFNYSNQILRALPADIIRYVSQTKGLTGDDLYRSTVINFVLSCEKKCAGSGILFLLLLNKSITGACTRKVRIESHDLQKVINFYLGSGDIASSVLDIFHNCGFEFNLKFSKSPTREASLIQTSAQKIKGHLDPIFHGTNIDSEYVLFCVDGVIESLGEIDPLLQWSTANTKKVILMAKRFNPDVSNTLKVNWDSKKLSVIPYVIDHNSVELASEVCKDVMELENGLRFGNIDFDSYDLVSVKGDVTGCIHVSNLVGDIINIDIFLPVLNSSIHSIIEERFKCGLAITKNCTIKGVDSFQLNGSTITVPSLSMDYALRAMKEWEKVNNISCVVTLEQKN